MQRNLSTLMRGAGRSKIATVMGEFKRGVLRSGSSRGQKVQNVAQAKAIALNSARKNGANIPTANDKIMRMQTRFNTA